MNVLSAVAERIGRNDMVQVLALYLAVLLIVLATRWPTAALPLNESWFALAPARNACLALIALGFGAHHSGSAVTEQRMAVLALGFFVVVAVPFDVLSYAASYPSTPLAWSLILPFCTVLAYFGVGLALGRLASLGHARMLLPILVPAVLAAGIWADVRLHTIVFNPFTAAVEPSARHAVVMAVVATISLLVLARSRTHRGRVEA